MEAENESNGDGAVSLSSSSALTPTTRLFHVSDGYSDRDVKLSPPLGLDLEAIVFGEKPVGCRICGFHAVDEAGARGSAEASGEVFPGLVVVSINGGESLTTRPFEDVVANIRAAINRAKEKNEPLVLRLRDVGPPFTPTFLAREREGKGIGPDYAQRSARALVLPGGVEAARSRAIRQRRFPSRISSCSIARATHVEMVDTYVAPLADSFIDRASTILEKSSSYILSRQIDGAAAQLRDAEHAMVEDIEKYVDKNQHANELNAVIAEREALRAECERLRESLASQEHGGGEDELRNEKRISNELRAKVEALQSEVSLLRSKVEEERERAAADAESASSATVKLRETNDMNALLQRDADGLKDELSTTTNRVFSLMKENGELVKTVSQLAAEKRNLIEELHASNDHRITSQTESTLRQSTSERRIDELESQLQIQLEANQCQTAKQNAELADTLRKNEELAAQLGNAQQQIALLAAELKKSQARAASLVEKIDDANLEISSSAAELEESRRCTSSLAAEIESVRAKAAEKNGELNASISRYADEMRSLQRRSDAHERQVVQLKEALIASQSQLNSASPILIAYQESQESCRALEAKVGEMEREIGDLRSKIQIDEELAAGAAHFGKQD